MLFAWQRQGNGARGWGLGVGGWGLGFRVWGKMDAAAPVSVEAVEEATVFAECQPRSE